MANKPLRIVTQVTGGKVSPHARQALVDFLPQHEGKMVIIEAKRYHKKRSLSQNAFYWAAVVPAVRQMFEDNGEVMDDEEVHAYLKQHVGKMVKVVLQPDGSRVRVLQSSKNLTTPEWETYIDCIRAWAGGYGYKIPMPNEYLEGLNEQH